MMLPSPHWDINSPSFRAVYLSLLPSVVVLALPPVVSSVPRLLPNRAKRYLIDIPQSYIGSFLTLDELYPSNGGPRRERPRWKTFALAFGALAQLQHVLLGSGPSSSSQESLVISGLLAVCWMYAAGWPAVVRRRTKPNVALLLFYTVQLVAASLTFATWLYARALDSATRPLPTVTIVSNAAAILVDLVLIGVTLSMPVVELPEDYIRDQAKLEADGHPGYSPEDRTSLAGWLTFRWVNPLIRLGQSGYLKEADLWQLSPVSRSAALSAKFALSSHLSIGHRAFKANGLDILIDLACSYACVVLNYIGPFLLKQIFNALEDRTPEKIAKSYVLATLALVVWLVNAEAALNTLWRGRRASIRCETEIMSAIFSKVLVAKDASGVGDGKKKAGTGKIVQLMVHDTGTIAEAITDLSETISVPFELVVCCTFLYSLLSWSAFVGLAAIVALMPVTAKLTSLEYGVYHELRDASDKRTELLTEIVNSIKMIKFFGWEQRYLDKADAARAKELRLSIKQSILGSIFTLTALLAPKLVMFISFFSYVYIQKRELTVSVAFTALSLFAKLEEPITHLPTFLVQAAQAVACAKRVDGYLGVDDVPDSVSSLESAASPGASAEPAETRIGFLDGARFKWNAGSTALADEEDEDEDETDKTKTANGAEDETPDEEPGPVFELGELSFIFPVGALTVISGPTGGGKTALLLALLGEMDLIEGSIALPKDTSRFDEYGLTNSVAYAGQTAWLQDLSVKGNILFGAPMDEARYNAVLQACALLPDLATFEDGDDTEIGAKGVSLSGGQKARVALARAVYSRAKHVLLDDPLAAVDSHTAAALVSDCLASPLLKNRTVIIVSHHVELLLPIAHSIVHIVDGRVEASGTVAELRADGHLGEIVAEEGKAHVEEETVVDQSLAVADERPKEAKVARKMTEDEDRAQGSVAASTYGVYLSAASWTVVAAVGTMMLFTDNSAIAERWWIAIWTRPAEATINTLGLLAKRGSLLPSLYVHQAQQAFSSSATANSTSATISALPSANDHPLFYLFIFLAIAVGFVIIGVQEQLLGYLGKYRASKKLHALLIRSIMRATPRWFDKTPTGRILNRVSSDIAVIDDDLYWVMTIVFRSAFTAFGSVVLILGILPSFIIPGTLICYVYYSLSRAYIGCARDLQRIKAVTTSPVLSGTDSTLIGIVTIRAFSAEKRFLDEFYDRIDRRFASLYLNWMCNRWLMLRFDCLGPITTFITIVAVLSTGTSAALGGMIILSSQSIMVSIYWCAREFAEMEMCMNAVERVNEYLSIPQEARLHIPETAPPAYWPSNSGETLISVEDLVIAYDPSLPPVIHGVSFDIKPREKIGLIGRTGSGKSTLGMSFLRFTEATSGRIMVDGIDISTIGLQTLREKVTIVPQDAVLFAGTIRSNLDPFEEHTDEELTDILHRVQLGLPSGSTAAPSRVVSSSNVAKLAGEGDVEDALKANSVETGGGAIKVTLDSEVSSGGQNFSQGQRQLIALGRALVRNNNILIMDEATASVDFETDNLIQQTIREEFSNSALITIAHRLSSIVDYDRLVVLDAGRIVEFDTPHNLLQNEHGVFRAMAERTGKFDELLASAERKSRST